MDIDTEVTVEEFGPSPKPDEFDAGAFLRGAVDKGRERDAAREAREAAKAEPVDKTPRPAASLETKEPEAAKAPSPDPATQETPEPGKPATSDPGPDGETATQRTDEGGKDQLVVDLEAKYKASSTEAKRLAHVAREAQQRLAEVSGELEQLRAQQQPTPFEDLSDERQRYYEWRAVQPNEHRSPELIYATETELGNQRRGEETQMLAKMHEHAAGKIAEHLQAIPEDFRRKILDDLAERPEFSSALDKMHPEAALEFGRHYLDQARELHQLRADNERLKAEQKVLTEAAYGDGIKDARQNITRKRRSGTEAGRDQTVEMDFSNAKGLKPPSMLDGLIASKDDGYKWVD